MQICQASEPTSLVRHSYTLQLCIMTTNLHAMNSTWCQHKFKKANNKALVHNFGRTHAALPAISRSWLHDKLFAADDGRIMQAGV